MEEEIISKHSIFKLTDWDQLITYFFGPIPGCCCFFDYYMQKKYKKLYTKGIEHLQKDFDLITLIRNNKNLITIAKSTILTNAQRLKSIIHSRDNVIDVDSDEDKNEGRINIQTLHPQIVEHRLDRNIDA